MSTRGSPAIRRGRPGEPPHRRAGPGAAARARSPAAMVSSATTREVSRPGRSRAPRAVQGARSGPHPAQALRRGQAARRRRSHRTASARPRGGAGCRARCPSVGVQGAARLRSLRSWSRGCPARRPGQLHVSRHAPRRKRGPHVGPPDRPATARRRRSSTAASAPCAIRRTGCPAPARSSRRSPSTADKQLPVQVPRDVEQWVKVDAGVKVVAGALFALGRLPRLTALALSASIVPTTLAGHRFWEHDRPDRALRPALELPEERRPARRAAARRRRHRGQAVGGLAGAPRRAARPPRPPRRASRRPRSAPPRRRRRREAGGQEDRRRRSAAAEPAPPPARGRAPEDRLPPGARPRAQLPGAARSAPRPRSSTASTDGRARPADPHEHAEGPQGHRPEDGGRRRRGAQGRRCPSTWPSSSRRYAELVPAGRRRRRVPRRAARRPARALGLVRRRQPDPRDGRGGDRRSGHEYMALTDHSPRLTVANGLTPERLEKQLDVVAALNEELAPFRILTGIECDINVDGSLDQTDELLGRLDVVVASVHSDLRADSAAMTARMLARGRQPAHRRPRALHRPAGDRPPAAQRHAEAAAGEPVRRRGGVRAPASSTARRSRSTPGPSGSTRRAGCSAWPSSWAASSPSTPTRTRPVSSTGRATAASGRSSAGVPVERVVNTRPADELLSWTAG